MAFSPNGVAPQPSPRKFAIILAEIYSIAGWSFGRFGDKKRSSGCIFSVIFSIMPEDLAISMTPIHMATIPAMVMQSTTASLADESAASVISPIRPVMAPYVIPMSIIAPQRILSMFTPPEAFSLLYVSAGYFILMSRFCYSISFCDGIFSFRFPWALDFPCTSATIAKNFFRR